MPQELPSGYQDECILGLPWGPAEEPSVDVDTVFIAENQGKKLMITHSFKVPIFTDVSVVMLEHVQDPLEQAIIENTGKMQLICIWVHITVYVNMMYDVLSL